MTALADHLRLLQTATTVPSAPSEMLRSRVVDYRISELDRTVPTFTGHEPSHVAEDWTETVDGLAHLNDWPLRVRLHFVSTNTRDAARSRFRSENFTSWDDLLCNFREVFVREIRLSDRWEALYKLLYSRPMRTHSLLFLRQSLTMYGIVFVFSRNTRFRHSRNPIVGSDSIRDESIAYVQNRSARGPSCMGTNGGTTTRTFFQSV